MKKENPQIAQISQMKKIDPQMTQISQIIKKISLICEMCVICGFSLLTTR